jgi:hypothetical protein
MNTPYIQPRTADEIGKVHEYVSPKGEVFEVTYQTLRRCGFSERMARTLLKYMPYLRYEERRSEAKRTAPKPPPKKRGRPKGRASRPVGPIGRPAKKVDTPDGEMTIGEFAAKRGLRYQAARKIIINWGKSWPV